MYCRTCGTDLGPTEGTVCPTCRGPAPNGAGGSARAPWGATTPGSVDVGPAGSRTGPAGSSPVNRSFGGCLQRGWRLVQMALAVLRDQPGLLVVPVATTALVAVLFVLTAVVAQALGGLLAFVLWVAGLVAMATAAVAGQAVIAHRVMAHLDGKPLTNGEALRLVGPKLPTLAAWGSLSLLVGVLIRSMERGRGIVGLLGRIAALFVAVAWSAMTFFVLPVICFEGLGVQAALSRSKAIVRLHWGEGVVGVGALNLLVTLCVVSTVAVAVLLSAAGATILAFAFVLIALVAMNLLSAVASPVFTVVLYRYATSGVLVAGFAPEDVAAAFRPRRRARLAVV